VLYKLIYGEKTDTVATVSRFETDGFHYKNILKDILVRQYPLGDRLLCEACPKEHRERLRTLIADRPIESHQRSYMELQHS
jgi:hypothetical protein